MLAWMARMFCGAASTGGWLHVENWQKWMENVFDRGRVMAAHERALGSWPFMRGVDEVAGMDIDALVDVTYIVWKRRGGAAQLISM